MLAALLLLAAGAELPADAGLSAALTAAAGAAADLAPDAGATSGGVVEPIAADLPSAWPMRLDELEVRGLFWTKEYVVRRELPWRPGALVSQADWELGTTRLWNTDLFGRVAAHLERRGGRTVAVYELEEHFSLNPLFSFGVGGGRWWIRAGANDNDWLGRYLEWGARYERFDVYNGGQGWLKDPRLFGKRLSGQAEVDYLIRPRPEYSRRRLTGIVEVLGEVDDLTRVGGRLEVFWDQYLTPLEGPPRLPPELVAGQLTGQLRMGRVDTERLRQKGWSLEARETVALVSSGPAPVVFQSFVELLWFRMFGERLNLAVRAQAALSSQAPTELGYYLGGLDLVRGFPDSLLRTERFALANVELRGTVFDSTWFAVVAAVFVDACLADVDGPRGLLSAGGGVRLLVPKFVKTGVRADLAVTLVGRPQLGVSFGVYQFF